MHDIVAKSKVLIYSWAVIKLTTEVNNVWHSLTNKNARVEEGRKYWETSDKIGCQDDELMFRMQALDEIYWLI